MVHVPTCSRKVNKSSNCYLSRMYCNLFLIVIILSTFVPCYSRSARKFDTMHPIINSLEDNCKSEKLREIILETVANYPHQYSHQARYMKEQAEDRFGNWWSAVIITDKGGYGMSAVYDQYKNTSCEIGIFDVFYWLGRTS